MDTFTLITKARQAGKLPRDITAALKAAGHPDPDAEIERYMNTPGPDGRPLGQVNPGDPDEHR